MMNYPYNRFAGTATPYGYPAQTAPMGGAQVPMFPQQEAGMVPPVPAGSAIPGAGGVPGPVPGAPGGPQSQLPLEQSYIENILRLNLGKIGTFYMTYENNREWNAKIFRGRVEAAGRDHIIISDPQSGTRFLLLMVNLDYVTFDEELNYFFPGQITTGR
ncbi:spore coat protein GerQ [Gorillibacterium sp. sgz5001074]|uniref:spore coat protein GerQ n=1 Tax=Gorillibacterium sp. sgz5001074 TaxID=3446695 RepID=UPI003F66CAAA